jgi:hypothetical protein
VTPPGAAGAAARPPVARRLTVRQRSWLWLACAAALVLIYLTLWTLYSMTHLSSFGRYEQVPPGGVTREGGADFRLLSLVQSEELASTDGEPQLSSSGAVWVVATLEVTQRVKDPNFLCTTELLGPDHRAWEYSTLLDADRSLSQFCHNEELKIGEPYRFEQVYEIPTRYADQVLGVVVVDPVNSTPQQVLTPVR